MNTMLIVFSHACLFPSRATHLLTMACVCVLVCLWTGSDIILGHKRGNHRDTTGNAWGQHKMRSSEQSYEC